MSASASPAKKALRKTMMSSAVFWPSALRSCPAEETSAMLVRGPAVGKLPVPPRVVLPPVMPTVSRMLAGGGGGVAAVGAGRGKRIGLAGSAGTGAMGWVALSVKETLPVALVPLGMRVPARTSTCGRSIALGVPWKATEPSTRTGTEMVKSTPPPARGVPMVTAWASWAKVRSVSTALPRGMVKGRLKRG